MGRSGRRLDIAGRKLKRMAVPPEAVLDHSRYYDDPVGWLTDVCGVNLWVAQARVAEMVRDNAQVVLRGCNGWGKDFIAACLAVWWVYVRKGKVLVTGPTERQVKEIFMRLVARLVRQAKLPGDIYELALRTQHHGSILAFTSNDASKLTGHHDPMLMVIITEAQGCEPEVWEAMQACLTGEDSRLLAVGNPLSPTGRFYEACRSPRWTALRLSALEHPNVVQGREVIPGAVTAEFVESIRAEYGEASGVYRARVLAEFPEDAEEALIARSWLEAAAERHASGALEAEARGQAHVAGLDVARFGADKSALCVRQGPVLRHLVEWQHLDTMQTCGRLSVELERLGYRQDAGYTTHGRVGVFRVPVRHFGPQHVQVVVDEVGVGGGVLDRLRELGQDVVAFNSGRSPTPGHEHKFLNLRAQAYWHLRRLLERGLIALPRDERLFDELCGTQWSVNSAGRIQIEGKDALRARLGRSPDKADAVAMAFFESASGAFHTFRFHL